METNQKVSAPKLKKQLGYVYLYAFTSNLRLTDAVWVVLLAARGFALWQIGLAEGLFHAVSLVAEVPSGMAADLLGRRRTLALSGVMAVASGLMMAFGPGFAAVCAAMGLKALSYNLISGTEEALTYDSLKAADRTGDYLQVDANVSQLQTLAGALSALASLLDKVLGFAGFYVAEALLGATRSLAALGLWEPVVTKAQATRTHYRLAELPARLVQQTRQSLAVLRANHRAALLIAADAAVCLPVYLCTMFLQQRLADQGWPTAVLGLPVLAIQLVGMLGTALGRRLPKGALRPLYVACALCCGCGAVLAGAAPAWGAVPGAMLVTVAVNVWVLHAMQQLNDAIPSDQRATIISMDSMAYSLLMIPVSPLVGWLGDVTGHSGAGLCALGAVVAGSALAVAVLTAAQKASAPRKGQ